MKKIFLLTILLLFVFAFADAQSSGWVWGRNGKGATTDEGASLATDSSGNIYATGYFSSPTDIFGNDTLINVGGNQNLFLVKYDSSGNVLWARSGTASTAGTGVATDNNGNIYVTGFFFSSTATFGTFTLVNSGGPGTGNFFLLKYDALGNIIWAKSGNSTSDVRGSSVATDPNGNIYVTGFFLSSAATFGTFTLNTVGGDNVFLVKYNSSGNVIWGKAGGGSDIYQAYGVAADISGNAYITGSFRYTSITFGSNNLIGAGGCDIYLVKYDSTGTIVWAKREGGTVYDEPYSVTTDLSGDIYLTGYFTSSTISFGTNTLTNSFGGENMFIVKYRSSGTVLWAHSAGGTNNTTGYDIATDNFKNVYVTGGFDSPLVFGTVSLSPPPASPNCTNHCDPMFIVKYDVTGNALCAAVLGSGGDDYNSVATDLFGNAYVGGDFLASPFPVGPDTLTLINPNSNVTSENIFVAKYNCNHLSSTNELANKEGAVIFPNPFSSETILKTKSDLKNANLILYNIFGQEVKTIKNISGKEIKLRRDDLPSGIYFIRLTQDNKILASEKLILVD